MAERGRLVVWAGGVILAAGLGIVGMQTVAARRATAFPDGLAALANGDLDRAAAAFDEAMSEGPEVADRAAFDLGVARNAQSRFAEAATAFSRAADLARTNAIRASAHYNRGIVLATQGALPQSLAAFAQALRAAPDHERARINYAIVKARLARDSSRQGQTPPPESQRDREREIQQTPDQAYGFTSGLRATRPVRSATDW